MMRLDVITLFPAMIRGFAEESILKRAAEMGAVEINFVDPRDFAQDMRRTVDDKPYGGGAGMLMKPEPLFEAIESVITPQTRVILMAPAGKKFTQQAARKLAKENHIIIICGHYEGIDQRVTDAYVNETYSIGDYVLTNGALPAAVVMDSVIRLLPGVLGGGEEATTNESFTTNLLEYPQYTRPPKFRGMEIPKVLTGGDHAAVANWRLEQAKRITKKNRPDLLKNQ